MNSNSLNKLKKSILLTKIVLTFQNFENSKAFGDNINFLIWKQSIKILGNCSKYFEGFFDKMFQEINFRFSLVFFLLLIGSFRKSLRVLVNTYSCTINGEACQHPCGRQPKYKGRNWCWIVQNWANIFGHRWDYCYPGPLKES